MAAPTSAPRRPKPTAKPDVAELGWAGVRQSFRQIQDDSPRELSGPQGRRILREMRDTDPTIGAGVTAAELLCRGVGWSVEPSDGSDEAKAEADFVDRAFGIGPDASGDMTTPGATSSATRSR